MIIKFKIIIIYGIKKVYIVLDNVLNDCIMFDVFNGKYIN